MPNRASVPSADFIRNIGYWQSEALRAPISITYHGRERLILATPDEFGGTTSDVDGPPATNLRTDAAAVLQNLEEGFIALDKTLRITTSNVAAEALFGLTPDMPHGATLDGVLPAPLGHILRERAQRVLLTRQADLVETSLPTGLVIACRLFLLADGVGVLMRNRTETHVMRAELEEEHALKAASDLHSRTALAKLDVRGRITQASPTLCSELGFAAHELAGHRLIELVSPALKSSFSDALTAVLSASAAKETTVSLIARHGEEKAACMALAPILSDFVPAGAMALFVFENEAATAANDCGSRSQQQEPPRAQR